jgi:indole-3-glycerol phosphate synthase
MNSLSPKLKPIIEAVRSEIKEAKNARPLSTLKARIKETNRPVGVFSEALRRRFGLIAEIKEKSPSAGAMRMENVRDAYAEYESSSIVSAISVLTNNSHFGMSIEKLAEAREKFSKPLLRKDFIIDEYQIFEAKAFGADAILLMANVLDKGKLHRFWQVATDIGLEVLFEAHTLDQIKIIPKGAAICGINCRVMDSAHRQSLLPVSYRLSRAFYKFLGDGTTDLNRFEMIRDLPHGCIKVAESGVSPSTVQSIKALRYNAALVGTSLLMASDGINSVLKKFENALYGAAENAAVASSPMSHAPA